MSVTGDYSGLGQGLVAPAWGAPLLVLIYSNSNSTVKLTMHIRIVVYCLQQYNTTLLFDSARGYPLVASSESVIGNAFDMGNKL